MKRLLEALAGTAELMQAQVSPAGLAMLAKDLSGFSIEHIEAALKQVRNGAQRFNPKAIFDALEKICPDGRPGADEAWAMIPRDEHTSAVMNNEIAQALVIAQPLLDEGDQIAARMAFKEAYTRIVQKNKQENIPPVWYASLGWDKNGRESVLVEAVRVGRLSQQQALKYMPESESLHKLELNHTFTPEQIEQNIKKITDAAISLSKVTA